ncbi:MAG: hypothetical protein IJ086_14115 [Clostridium sp.]|nr:hypothetical protein [Clostridium sp.]
MSKKELELELAKLLQQSDKNVINNFIIDYHKQLKEHFSYSEILNLFDLVDGNYEYYR